jgi:hypothetical protein
MKTENAIKALIKARNEKYNSKTLHIKVSEERSWSNKKVLTITGHEVAVYFSAMASFLCPMIATYVEVIDNTTVKIELN